MWPFPKNETESPEYSSEFQSATLSTADEAGASQTQTLAFHKRVPAGFPKPQAYYRRNVTQQLEYFNQFASPGEKAGLKEFLESKPLNSRGLKEVPPSGMVGIQAPEPNYNAGDPRPFYPPDWNSPYQPQNASSPASMLMGSYSIDDNTQRRPTLYNPQEQQSQPHTAMLQTKINSTMAIPHNAPFEPVEGSDEDYPNLLVDIALMSQRTFPFEYMATRHGVPMERVIEIFSAIIQIPLLINAADARRYGELGSERLRDFKNWHFEKESLKGNTPKPRRNKRKNGEMEPVQGETEPPAKRTQKRQKFNEDSAGGSNGDSPQLGRDRPRRETGEVQTQKLQTVDEDEDVEWMAKLLTLKNAMVDGEANEGRAAGT